MTTDTFLHPTPDRATRELRFIEKIIKDPYGIAELHNTLSSPRGNYFRIEALSMLGTALSESRFKSLIKEVGLKEYKRHINKLIDLGLVKEKKEGGRVVYARTDLGEKALNSVRALERAIGKEASQKIFGANFRHNSIRLFFHIYVQDTKPVVVKNQSGEAHLEVRYSPQQLSHLASFFQRSIDGVAAIDKLDTGALLEYRDDGYVYFNAKKARAFYHYIKNLYFIVLSRELE